MRALFDCYLNFKIYPGVEFASEVSK